MVFRELSQPSNYLISRLGLYNSWSVEFSYYRLSLQPTLAHLFIQNLIRLVFKNGLIFLSHPFRNRIFSLLRGFYPLPRFFTVEDMYKFYRLHQVKAKLFKTYKTEFILRKVFRKIIFSTVRLYSLNNWVAALCTAHIPTFYKHLRSHNISKSISSQEPRPGLHLKGRSGAVSLALRDIYAVNLLSSFFLRSS